jgi:hypothetical protein
MQDYTEDALDEMYRVNLKAAMFLGNARGIRSKPAAAASRMTFFRALAAGFARARVSAHCQSRPRAAAQATRDGAGAA